MMRTLLARIRGFFSRRELDARLDEEVRAHLDDLAAEYVQRGVAPEQARLAARRSFGGVEPMKEVYRDHRGLRWLEDGWRDVRHSARMLGRDPGLVLVAVLTLALGIGANTALFSVIDGLMLKPLPVRAGNELRILTVVTSRPPAPVPGFSFSYPLYEDVQKRTDVFSGVVAFGNVNPVRLTVGRSDGAGAQTPAAEVARGQAVSGTFFSVLGIDAAAGRVLDSGDDRLDAPAVAIISDGFWARRFGRDPRVIGRAITVNEVPFTIVGVAPASFHGFQIDADPDLWWSLLVMPRDLRAPTTMISDRRNQSWRIVVRLRPGVEDAHAQAQVEQLFKADASIRLEQLGARQGVAAVAPARRVMQTIRLESGAAGWTTLRWQFRQPLFVLMVVVALVLLIACANVANLLLARATARRREIAVRMALGSGRPRVVRQLLTESIVLASIGGVFGVGVAFLGTRLIASFIERQDASLSVTPDARVLLFTTVVSLASALLFGLMPALTATRLSFTAVLNEHGRAMSGAGRLTMHNAIVAAQIALSVVVLIAAGLFIRTLTNLQRLDSGFEAENLNVFSVSMPSSYEPAHRMDLYERLLERIDSNPGTRASYSMFGVMSGNGFSDGFAVTDSAPLSDEEPNLRGILVGPGFFDVVGTRIVAGRGFEPSDARSPVLVAVVNQTMARRFFGTQPIGKRFTIPRSFPGESFEIVGVAIDSKYRSLRAEAEEALPIAYLPASQPPGASLALRMRDVQVEVRARVAAGALEPTIRRIVRELDPGVAVTDVRAMSDFIDRTIAQERMLARLAMWLGMLALALGAIGIYGVRSYAVRRRAHEIGLRIALGATAGRVFRLIVGQGFIVAAIGIAIGLAAAAGLSRFVKVLLFGVEPLDPSTFVAVAAIFVCIAVMASYLPARRAARVDPAATLRSE